MFSVEGSRNEASLKWEREFLFKVNQVFLIRFFDQSFQIQKGQLPSVFFYYSYLIE